MSNHQGGVSQQVFNMLLESQHWSREQMLQHQRSQLEQLLRHAKANVPFYKTRLDCVFRRDGSIDWDRWEDIPILTKQEVRENSRQLHAINVPASHGVVRSHTTSATTSVPITVLHTELEEAFWNALNWRAHTWWGVDWNKNLMRWHQPDADEVAGAELKRWARWGPNWGIPLPGGEYYAIAHTINLRKRLKLLAETNTAYLHTLSSFAFLAALESTEKLGILRLEAIFSSSVAVEIEHETECMAKFGAKIHSSYSSKEAGRIAYTCQSNQCYHVSEEAVLCEIVDVFGKPLPPDSVGNILVTPYMCAAMPLIRYAQGDRAQELESCDCGRGLRTISSIEGRVYHLFLSPTGRRFAAKVPDWLRVGNGVVGWQFAQIEAGKIEVRYMSASELSGQKLHDARAAIAQLMHNEFDIQFKKLDKLPETASGKFIKYVNEYSPKL